MWTCKKSNQLEPAVIHGFRTLASGNIVICFADADVVVPGNWNFDEADGIPEAGQCWSAYWTDEVDADSGESRRRLHIHRDKSGESKKRR